MNWSREATIGADGELRLDGLPFLAGERVRVTLTLLPVSWPEGYFEATFGSIDDRTFIRDPQCEFEDRGRHD